MAYSYLRSFVFIAVIALATSSPVKRPQPDLHDFIFEFIQDLSNCNVKGVIGKMTKDYVLYEADGESHGKHVYEDSLVAFCKGPLKDAVFQIREEIQVAKNVLFIRGQVTHPKFNTNRNRILFSAAFSVKLVHGQYKIFREVRSLVAHQFAAALAPPTK